MIKRTIFAWLILLTFTVSGQYKFAWITDTHIGHDEADTELRAIVKNINDSNEIKFVVVTGDITEKGLNNELETAHTILGSLNKPYHIIPGNHDSKWSESGCTKFTELWDDDKFSFKFQDHVYIGLNSSIPWKGGGGHIKPEDLDWLKSQLAEIDSSSEIYILTHHQLNEEIDNWYMVSNLLRDHNFIVSYNGHGHENTINEYRGIKQVMSRAAISKNLDSWGYTIVENDSADIFFYEVTKNNSPEKWGSLKKSKSEIEYVKPEEFMAYSTEIVSRTNLQKTLSASPLIWYDRIITADYSGIVSCFDTSLSLLWDYDAFGNVLSKPVEKDGYLVVGTLQGDLITIKAKSGEPVQSIFMDYGITSQLIAIDYEGNKSLMFPKQSNSKAAVILGNSGGRVSCYDIETLQEYWINNKPEGMIETKPLLLDNKMYFGCWDSYFYSIDVRSGSLIWKWNANNNFYYSPAAVEPVTDGKKIYITTPEKYVYALDARLGTLEWKKMNYNAWESIGISNDNRLLYIKSYTDHFHIVSTITSNWVRDINIKFGLDTMPTKPIEWNDKIIFGSKSGFVYMIDSKWNFEPVLYLGPARVHSVQHFRDNIFLASNMDGHIVLFKL